MPIQALPKEDQEKLLKLVDREVIEKHFSSLDETAQVLDDMGVESKAANVEAETQEPEAVEVEAVEEIEQEPEVSEIDEADLVRLAQVVEAQGQLIAELQTEIKSLKTAEKKRKAKAKPQTLRAVVARLGQSSIEKAKPIDGRTTAAKTKPSTPKVENNHALSGIFGGLQ